ncbi:MAG TPA: Flp pilus assembly protein CpaB [Candidatus Omnitrophota bacterium]|nr:Flp pilus assembly protein CpaB [Candidatus Omnitrophota bacterium]
MDKRKLSIVLAVVLALMGVVMIRNYISQTEKKFVKEEKKAYVLIASTNIPAGTTIDETMIKFDAVPEKYVQPKAISSQSLAVGKRAVADILPGEQIMSTKLTISVKDTSLAMLTPQGKRAMTITMPFLSAVGGKVKRGDYVDLVGTFPYNAQVDGKTVTELVSVTLFQNVLVLGVEGGAAPERGKVTVAPTDLVITLALSPKEIALLTYAMDQGKLRLVLRPPLETAIEPVPPVEVNTLWQYVFSNLGQEFVASKEEKPQIIKQQEKKEEVAPAPVPTVEIYRGTEKSNMVMK